MTTDTQKPVALVAGASRGLGLAIARELGQSGYHTMITARTEADIDRARDLLSGEGLDVAAYTHDVRNAQQTRELVQRIEDEHGPIEVAIAVAGVLKVGPVPERAEEYTESIEIMMFGPINVAHAVLPGMRERHRGRIGVVTSIAATVPIPHLVPYSAAKFGALGFARGLTEELQGTGISVSTIIPGLMRTGGHWNGDYTGQPTREYAWFTAISALPVISIDAERAAEVIVRGVLTRKTTIMVTVPARLIQYGYRLAPTTMIKLMGLTGRLLPGRGDQRAPGHQAAEGLRSDLYARITRPARRAVERYQQRTTS